MSNNKPNKTTVIIVAVVIIIVGILLGFIANDMGATASGIKVITSTGSGTIAEHSNLSPAAKGFKALEYVMIVAGVAYLIYGITLKKD